MEITAKEKRFLAKRTKLVQTWPLVGGILLCLVLGLGVWLFLSTPLLANPFTVLSKLRSNSIPVSTLTLMAGLLPVAILMCLVLAIAMVAFSFAAFSNEKKYIAMVERMRMCAASSRRGELKETGAAKKTASKNESSKPRR